MSTGGIGVGILVSRGPGQLERTLGAALHQASSTDSIWVALMEDVEGPLDCAARVEEADAAHGHTTSIGLLPPDPGARAALFKSEAEARNAVIEVCRGEMVAFLDDGGMPDEGWLEAIRRSLDDPGVDAIAGRIVVPGLSPGRNDPPGGKIRWTGHLQMNFASDRPGPSTLASGRNCAVRRSLAVRLGGFDEAFTGGLPFEDVEFFTRIGKAGGRTRFVPDASVVVTPERRSEEGIDVRLENLEAQAARSCAMAAIFARHEVWALLIMATSHLLQSVMDVIAGRLPNNAPLRILTEVGEGIRMGVRPVESRLKPRKRRRR